jgi:predicted LPLAT superfamily acyltransferase
MKFMLLVYLITGRWGFRLILFPVMVYYYLVRGEARRASKQYLQYLQLFSGSDQAKTLSSFKHFLMFGEIMLDKLLVWMGRIRKEDVVFENPEVIDSIDSHKKGGIIIISHLGNIEVSSALAHQKPDLRLTILVYTKHAEKFNSLMKKVNSSTRIEMLQVTDMSPATAMILSERIDAGEFIVIAGDRTPVTGHERVSKVRFLGGIAPMPQGAFILAGLLKCPVYLMFCLKLSDKYHIYVELFSEKIAFHRKDRGQMINKAVQQYASRLEQYCMKAPLQWFNFFPFWCDELEAKEGGAYRSKNDSNI